MAARLTNNRYSIDMILGRLMKENSKDKEIDNTGAEPNQTLCRNLSEDTSKARGDDVVAACRIPAADNINSASELDTVTQTNLAVNNNCDTNLDTNREIVTATELSGL